MDPVLENEWKNPFKVLPQNVAEHQNPTTVWLPAPHRISKCLTRVKFEWAAASASDMQIGKSIISACILPAQKWWSVLSSGHHHRHARSKKRQRVLHPVWINSWERPFAYSLCVLHVCMYAPWWMMRRPSIRHQSWPRAITSNAAGRPLRAPAAPFFACLNQVTEPNTAGLDNCIPSAIMCCDEDAFCGRCHLLRPTGKMLANYCRATARTEPF